MPRNWYAATGVGRIEDGFSGGPVYAVDSGRVIGIVVDCDLDGEIGGAIPIKNLVEVFPSELKKAVIPQCPYPGLEPFGYQDREFYYGRKESVKRLESAVNDRQVVVVVVLREAANPRSVFAGLLGRLSQKSQWHTATFDDEPDGDLVKFPKTFLSAGFRQSSQTGQWRVIAFRPRTNPFLALASAFVGLLPDIERFRLVTNLGPANVPRSDLVSGIASSNPGIRNFLIIVDQFEELFNVRDENDRARFFELLAGLANISRDVSKIKLVITLRNDLLRVL